MPKLSVFASQSSKFCLPGFGTFVPSSLFNGGVKPDMFVKLIFVSDIDEIIEDFFLARIFSGPVRIGFEGKGIEMAPDVLL